MLWDPWLPRFSIYNPMLWCRKEQPRQSHTGSENGKMELRVWWDQRGWGTQHRRERLMQRKIPETLQIPFEDSAQHWSPRERGEIVWILKRKYLQKLKVTTSDTHTGFGNSACSRIRVKSIVILRATGDQNYVF